MLPGQAGGERAFRAEEGTLIQLVRGGQRPCWVESVSWGSLFQLRVPVLAEQECGVC